MSWSDRIVSVVRRSEMSNTIDSTWSIAALTSSGTL